jgi:hypothetical protein
MKTRLSVSAISFISITLSVLFVIGRAQFCDASNPPPPDNTQAVEFVGYTGGRNYVSAVQGNHAYVGEGYGLAILDVSNPASPVVVGRTPLFPEMVSDVAVAGPYAYVSIGAGGLRIIDVSSSDSPAEVGFYGTVGAVWDVAISGSYAYLAGADGLSVVDVSTPSDPLEVGLYPVPPYGINGIAVAGNYAYLVDANVGGGLRVVSISDPANPVEVGFYETPAAAENVAIAGTYAYVADNVGGLRVVNVSNPASPSEVASISTWVAFDVAVVDGYAYVTDGDGLRVVDVSVPDNPVEVGFCVCDWPAGTNAIAATGGTAYIGTEIAGLRVVDVSDPAHPAEISYYDGPSDAEDVVVVGGYAYVADSYWGLRVVDVSVPSLPVEVGFSETAYGQGLEQALEVAVVENYAYLAKSLAGLRVVDVSNPANPMEVGSYETPNSARTVALAGQYAYVGAGELSILDVSDPSNPALAGTSDVYPVDIAIDGDYAYVSDNGLWVLDITDPVSPTKRGHYLAPWHETTWALAVSGHNVYLCEGHPSGSGRLRVIDVSDPDYPTAVGSYELLRTPTDVAVTEDYVYVTSGGLWVLDVVEPTQPAYVGFYQTPWDARGVAVDGGQVYLANKLSGLIVLRFQPPKITGRVSDGSGNPVEDILILANGSYSATTDASGQYTMPEVHAGIYTLAPMSAGYLWSPASRTVIVPPSATEQDFAALNIQKTVTPDGTHAVEFGDSLTYTVRLLFPEEQNLVLYDPVPPWTAYITGSLSGPPGLVYDPVADTISGTLHLSATVLTTASFAVRVEVTGTAELAPIITNQSCVYPIGGGTAECLWSNQVRSYTFVFDTYLPLVLK